MFSYYGSKSKVLKNYPEPIHDTIIEPFAGSAQYSYKYWQKNVILVEKFKKVYDVWDWLINEATPSYIMSLPLFAPYERVEHENPVVRDLMCFESNRGQAGSAHTAGKFNRWYGKNGNGAGRKRMADNVHKIKHWKIIHGNCSLAPDIEATWFIDPPYDNKAGTYYKHNCLGINYDELGDWCKSRRGQVMVCEDLGASWLDFRFLAMAQGQKLGKNPKDISVEAIWTNDGRSIRPHHSELVSRSVYYIERQETEIANSIDIATNAQNLSSKDFNDLII